MWRRRSRRRPAVLQSFAVDESTGAASFPREIIKSPRSWCEAGYNLTHWTDMPRGGHFAAFEQPELFVDDLRTFFGTIR